MQADDGGDGGEGTDAEDEEESDLFARWAVNSAEGGDGEEEDPDVGDDVEAGGNCGWCQYG